MSCRQGAQQPSLCIQIAVIHVLGDTGRPSMDRRLVTSLIPPFLQTTKGIDESSGRSAQDKLQLAKGQAGTSTRRRRSAQRIWGVILLLAGVRALWMCRLSHVTGPSDLLEREGGFLFGMPPKEPLLKKGASLNHHDQPLSARPGPRRVRSMHRCSVNVHQHGGILFGGARH